jgi:MFS transporter, SHS family, sialic acid transporter
VTSELRSNFDHTLPQAEIHAAQLSPAQRYSVLLASFAGLVFAGVGLGLMPVASRPITKSFMALDYSEAAHGVWLARYTAAIMLGAACGGIWLGRLGDRIGRSRAMGVSILIYSLFAGAGALAGSQVQLLALRFLAGLGIGGIWPTGAALVAECFPGASRPIVAGVVGAGINVGILFLAAIVQLWPVESDSWRWVFAISAVPAALGVAAMSALPESPKWLAASRTISGSSAKRDSPLKELLRPPLLRSTAVGIALGAVPLVGAWAASKWMIPWAGEQAGKNAATQASWAAGAVLGGFFGAPLASWLGRRLSYFLISLATTLLTCGLFRFTTPTQSIFLPWVFIQGIVATLFFGWLPLCLPELFPTRVRAAGAGVTYNTGRFLTAAGALAAGALITAFDGNYSDVGAITGLVYALGMIVIWWMPIMPSKSLDGDRG